MGINNYLEEGLDQVSVRVRASIRASIRARVKIKDCEFEQFDSSKQTSSPLAFPKG